MDQKITTGLFSRLLPLLCAKDTSSDPEKWTPENPLYGHCAVVALVAQNLFSGELLRGSLNGTLFSHLKSHYWNKLSADDEIDFTAPQFENSYPSMLSEPRTRHYVLYDPNTGRPREIMNRYKLFALRLVRALNPDNPLFGNDIYQKCFYNALDSPCQKMKFGVVVYHNSEIIYEGHNKTIEPLRSLCEPTCIRFNIPSRTESMIGACGHAEEKALWEIVKMGIPLNQCKMYVAGIYPTGLPYLKEETVFTCLRCAVPLYLSDIKRIFVPVIDHWEGMSGEECVKTARAYAMKEKVI